MNKVYFLAPLLALLVFAGAYTVSRKGQLERAEARRIALKADQDTRRSAEVEARRAALDESLRVQARRKKERAENEAREAAAREARAAALDARDLAFREQERLARLIERLKRDIAAEQEAVDRLQIDHDATAAEQDYLKTFVPQARANAAALERVLSQIAAAEAARAKQAAEDAKKKS